MRALLGIALVALSSCVSGAAREPSSERTTLASRLQALGLTREDLEDPSAVSAEMEEWILRRIAKEGSQEERARSLLEAVAASEGLDLEYSASFTGTAREVFASRQANCLGFTHLVVGLGRAAGIPVYYLGFRQRPRFERDGDLVVVWEHVTAGFGPAGARLILQLAVGPTFQYEDAQQLAEETALAMHYSNRGAELLREGDLRSARRTLEIATAIDPTWAHAWANLGVVRRRLGDLDGAERAYRRAIDASPDHFQAYQNLAILLWLQGRRDAADDLMGMLDHRENRDPFAFLSLGDLSRRSGRLDEARRFYRRAARLDLQSAEPLAALGLVAALNQKPRRARRLLTRAEQRDPDDARVRELRELLSPEKAGSLGA